MLKWAFKPLTACLEHCFAINRLIIAGDQVQPQAQLEAVYEVYEAAVVALAAV